ncbi:MAG: hypothetical protein OXI01_23380, partial [Albidovulum sp.]|nr:hypothetical protein [Albidovulum sp.]
ARRVQHTRRYRGAGDAGVAVAEAGFAEGFPEAEVLKGLQADPLAADPARILVLEAVEFDLRRPRRLLSTRAAELAPLLPGHGESGAEVEKGDLADLSADALGTRLGGSCRRARRPSCGFSRP